MTILAIDCSQRFCAAALYEPADDFVRASASLDLGRGHAERLPALVNDLLAQAGAGFPDLSKIAVTLGPGSFAGIRVGVSFARGLALALDVPVVGISTLRAMAEPVARRESRPVMAALDAKRGGLWCAVFDIDANPLSEPAELVPEAAARLLLDAGAIMAGNAWSLLEAAMPELSGQKEHLNRTCDAPDIAEVARIAARLDPMVSPAEPVYLRAADAKPQAGFAIARAD